MIDNHNASGQRSPNLFFAIFLSFVLGAQLPTSTGRLLPSHLSGGRRLVNRNASEAYLKLEDYPNAETIGRRVLAPDGKHQLRSRYRQLYRFCPRLSISQCSSKLGMCPLGIGPQHLHLNSSWSRS